jgi:hypothetical protein
MTSGLFGQDMQIPRGVIAVIVLRSADRIHRFIPGSVRLGTGDYGSDRAPPLGEILGGRLLLVVAALRGGAGKKNGEYHNAGFHPDASAGTGYRAGKFFLVSGREPGINVP